MNQDEWNKIPSDIVVRYISRKDAVCLINTRLMISLQGDDVDPLVKEIVESRLAQEEPSRLRNYEYEDDLFKLFGGVWRINENCPFNGEHGWPLVDNHTNKLTVEKGDIPRLAEDARKGVVFPRPNWL